MSKKTKKSDGKKTTPRTTQAKANVPATPRLSGPAMPEPKASGERKITPTETAAGKLVHGSDSGRRTAAVATPGSAGVTGAPTLGASPGGPTRDPRLPAVGTTLMKRDRLGRARCECHVEAAGIRYRGTLHSSLSAAASAAAADLGIGKRVNGFVFWGLAKASRTTKNPTEGLRKLAARYEEGAAALLNDSSLADVHKEIRDELQAHAAHLTDLLSKAAA
jgi:hypothetical protein